VDGVGEASHSFYRSAGKDYEFDETSGESHRFAWKGGGGGKVGVYLDRLRHPERVRAEVHKQSAKKSLDFSLVELKSMRQIGAYAVFPSKFGLPLNWQNSPGGTKARR
jgi:hypothetical protein